MKVAWLLRIEGLAALVVGVLLYRDTGSSWWLFAALILAPDIAMLGYLVSPRLGAACYNAAHLYLGPAALLLAGYLGQASVLSALGAVWLAHIGADRLLGYGLKYPTAFKDTHLQRV